MQPHIVYSGADDCTFKGWDARVAAPVINWSASATSGGGGRSGGGLYGGSGGGGYGGGNSDSDEGERSMQLFGNRRAHAAGVCCIAGHAQQEHLVATGSYDESIRLWDMRKVEKPVVAAQVGRGGAWGCLHWEAKEGVCRVLHERRIEAGVLTTSALC